MIWYNIYMIYIYIRISQSVIQLSASRKAAAHVCFISFFYHFQRLPELPTVSSWRISSDILRCPAFRPGPACENYDQHHLASDDRKKWALHGTAELSFKRPQSSSWPLAQQDLSKPTSAWDALKATRALVDILHIQSYSYKTLKWAADFPGSHSL